MINDGQAAPLILASASPRRRELLAQAVIPFVVHPVDIDESPMPGEPPAEMVERLAGSKAAAAGALFPNRVILAADTTVVLDGQIIGKPVDMDEARSYINRLSGRKHEVYTGVCIEGGGSDGHLWHAVTAVTFNTLTPDFIERYLAAVQPLDKAGGYGIQVHEKELIARYDGLRSTVVGLPIEDVIGKL